jgi:hypothetical protein
MDDMIGNAATRRRRGRMGYSHLGLDRALPAFDIELVGRTP